VNYRTLQENLQAGNSGKYQMVIQQHTRISFHDFNILTFNISWIVWVAGGFVICALIFNCFGFDTQLRISSLSGSGGPLNIKRLVVGM
jgi:hypothetical protein